MILGAEIGITVYGLIALFRGKFSLGGGRELVGLPARMMGLLCLATLPLVVTFGIVVGIVYAIQGVDMAQGNPLQFIWIDIVVLVAMFAVVTLLGKTLYNNQQRSLPASSTTTTAAGWDPNHPNFRG